jgi:hypothetical protein
MLQNITIYPDDKAAYMLLYGKLAGQQLQQPTARLLVNLAAAYRLITKLAMEYAEFPLILVTPEARDFRLCWAYSQYLRNPSGLSSPLQLSEVQDFCHVLRVRNAQSIAAQSIAAALGWWEGEVQPFLVRPGGDYTGAREEMTAQGVPVYEMVSALANTEA